MLGITASSTTECVGQLAGRAEPLVIAHDVHGEARGLLAPVHLVYVKTAIGRYLLAADGVGLSDLSAFAISAFRASLHGLHVRTVLDWHLLDADHVHGEWILLLALCLLISIVATALIVLLDLSLLVCLQFLTPI